MSLSEPVLLRLLAQFVVFAAAMWLSTYGGGGALVVLLNVGFSLFFADFGLNHALSPYLASRRKQSFKKLLAIAFILSSALGAAGIFVVALIFFSLGMPSMNEGAGLLAVYAIFALCFPGVLIRQVFNNLGKPIGFIRIEVFCILLATMVFFVLTQLNPNIDVTLAVLLAAGAAYALRLAIVLSVMLPFGANKLIAAPALVRRISAIGAKGLLIGGIATVGSQIDYPFLMSYSSDFELEKYGVAQRVFAFPVGIFGLWVTLKLPSLIAAARRGEDVVLARGITTMIAISGTAVLIYAIVLILVNESGILIGTSGIIALSPEVVVAFSLLTVSQFVIGGHQVWLYSKRKFSNLIIQTTMFIALNMALLIVLAISSRIDALTVPIALGVGGSLSLLVARLYSSVTPVEGRTSKPDLPAF